MFSPDHSSKKQTIKTDRRRTLVWNGNLIYLPEDGRSSLPFYNNDNAGGYTIIVQGITTNGRLIRIRKELQ